MKTVLVSENDDALLQGRRIGVRCDAFELIKNVRSGGAAKVKNKRRQIFSCSLQGGVSAQSRSVCRTKQSQRRFHHVKNFLIRKSGQHDLPK